MGQTQTSNADDLLARERQQRQQAEVLQKIGTTLSAVLDFDKLLDLLLDQLALIMPDDSVEIIFILDDVSRVVRQRKRPFPNIIKHDITNPLALSFTIAKTKNQQIIINSGKPLIIPDIQKYEGWLHTNHIPRNFHSWAGVPLFANDTVQAILAVYSEQTNAYHEEDIARLLAFARQAELAMQNAMLYQSTKRRLDELSTLQELTALATAATDEGLLLSQATAIIEKIFYTDNFGILLANDDGTRLVIHSSYHTGTYSTAFTSISVNKGVTGYVFRTGEVVRSGAIRQHPHFVEVDTGTLSELCVPLRSGAHTLGVINVESNKADAYSDEDERLMSTIADQLTTAVIKIRLLAQEKQHQQETEALRVAGNALVASLSLDDVLENILVELEKLIHFDSAGVLLLEGKTLLFAAGRGFSPQTQKILIGQQFPFRKNTLTVRMMKQRTPTVVEDMRTEPSFNYWGGTTYIRGWMGAPLVARSEIIGFLTADSREVGAYGDRDQQIIQMFANQAAIAIENARLYEAEKKARETAVILQKAAITLTGSHDLDTVLNQLLTSLAELVAYDSANITFLENGRLVHKVLRGYEKWGNAGEECLDRGWEEGFNIKEYVGFSTVFANKKPYIIDDTTLIPNWKKTAVNGHIRGWLGVPLYAGNSIIGCISLDKTTPHFFTEEHIQLTESLAAQTAVIIQSTFMFSEMESIGVLLRTLNATPRVIDALPIIIPLVESAANCQFASISILDDSAQIEYSHYTITNDDAHPVVVQRLKVEDTIVGDKVSNGEIVYLPQLELAMSHAVEKARYKTGIRSRIILPLIAGTEVIGSLNLGWSMTHGYDTRKISLFKRIASAIALAVERGDLYDQSRRQKAELETLFSVSTSMRLAVTIPDILNTLIEHVRDVVNPIFISVLLAEYPSGDLVSYSHHDVITSEHIRRVPQGHGICGRVFESGSVYTTTRLMDDPLVHILPEERPYLSDIGGSITLPLRTQARTIGVIHIGLLPAYTLSDADTRLLMGISEIAGSALDRALMVETLEQRVDARTHELTIANQRLTELDRLKSKFVSDVSHELRTPITNLGLYVQLMQRGNIKKQAYYLNVLQLQSERLKNLVEDILSLSRLERLKGDMVLTAVQPNAIITTIIAANTIQSKIGNLALTTALSPDLPPALSDNNHLSQIVTNLLLNALNYTDKGGVQISTTLDAESDMICITVNDSGNGINEKDMPYIFDRFYRGHGVGSSSIPGTGLGLSIVKEIVELHNGRLSIESTIGKGTTARVWLQKAP